MAVSSELQSTDGLTPDLDHSLAALLERTAGGDEPSFAALYDATSRRVFGLALQILGDRSAAEEATLEVFTYLWRRAVIFDPGRGAAMTWILSVARSKSIDLLRSRTRRKERESPLDTIADPRDLAPGPEAMSATSQQSHKVKRALASLPKEQREAIETAYFAGLSHSEAAAALGEPLGTIKTRIRTGLSSLRRVLKDEIGGRQ